MILSEKIVNTDKFGGTVDLISGIEDFKSTCTYDDEWHTYRINDKIIPSVTRLLEDDSYNNVNEEPVKESKSSKFGFIISKKEGKNLKIFL